MNEKKRLDDLGEGDACPELDELRRYAGELAEAHRVWAMAWCGPPSIRTMGPPLEGDAPQQHLELLARAALTDAIAKVCDGPRSGGTEQHVRSQLRAILGDPEYAQLSSTLETMRDRDRNPPGSINDRMRVHVKLLSELAGTLQSHSTARRIITAILQNDGELFEGLRPQSLPDRLFRELVTSDKLSAADAEAALSSAFSIVSFNDNPLQR